MSNLITYAIIAAVSGAVFYFMHQSSALEAELSATKLELEARKAQIKVMQKREDILRQSSDALSELVQSCIRRESAARADAEKWRQILSDMETREMTAKEKKEVPDDKSRAALLDDLDAPL